MSWLPDLNRYIARPAADWLLALRAWFLLGAFRAAVLLRPFPWVLRTLRLEGLPPSTPLLPYARGEFEGTEAARVRWAVSAAARRTPWRSECLPQALAALVLLRRKGVAGTLVLGVAPGEDESPYRAHAWLGVEGRVLIGERGVRGYTPVSAFGPRGVGAGVP